MVWLTDFLCSVEFDYSYNKLGFLKSTDHVWFATGKTLYIWIHLTRYTITLIDIKQEDSIGNVEVIKMSTHSILAVSTKMHLFLSKLLKFEYFRKLEIDEEVELIIIETNGAAMSNF